MNDLLMFDCRLYVSALGPIRPVLSREAGPHKTIEFAPIEYNKLVDPSFRHLIEAFETLPRPLQTLQV